MLSYTVYYYYCGDWKALCFFTQLWAQLRRLATCVGYAPPPLQLFNYWEYDYL